MQVRSANDVWDGFVDGIGVDCSVEESMTQQHFKDEVDINNIMARYERGILTDYVNQNAPRYAEIDNVDFHEAMNIVAAGNSMFEAMPAEQRRAFDNDPRKFFDAIHDPSQEKRLRDLGLLKPAETDTGGTPVPDSGAAGGPKGPGAASGGGTPPN